MNFFKKNWSTLLMTAFLVVVLLVPDFRAFLQRQILMKPSLEKVQDEVTITDEEMDIQLKGINVPSTNLKNLKGKIIFLNFWGTWCPPCRAEWPTIQNLYDAKKEKMDFVLIAMQDKEEDVVKFLKDKNYTVPVYIAQSPLSAKLLPKVFPTTFIIGRDGRILKKDDGAADWNSKSVHSFVDSVTK